MSAKRKRAQRKRPQQARSRETVEAILGAATRVLSREGYDRASTNRIAEVAGVSIGSLYQFFPNKQAIFAALRQRFFEELTAVFEAEAPRLRGEKESLRLGVELILRARRKNRALHRALDEELPFSVGFDDTLHRQALHLARDRFGELPAALRPADREMTARICVTALDAVTRMASVQYPEYLDREDFADEVTELLWRFVVREDRSRRAPPKRRRAS